MGIALLAFSSLSYPVRALTQFLARPGRTARAVFDGAAPNDGRATRSSGSLATDVPMESALSPCPALASGSAPRQTQPTVLSSASTSVVSHTACVLPSIALPTTAGAAPFTPMVLPGARAVSTSSVHLATAANADWFHGTANAQRQRRSATQKGPMLRVLRRLQASDPAKLVISGRMADVCAELDRLAASEPAFAG